MIVDVYNNIMSQVDTDLILIGTLFVAVVRSFLFILIRTNYNFNDLNLYKKLYFMV
jgi:hypothetical protein